MSGHICMDEEEIWRNNLRNTKVRKNLHTTDIAAKAALSEKTVARVFSGESKSPGVDIVRRIINAMGCSWGEIFAESAAVITTLDVECLYEQIKQLSNEIDEMKRSHAEEVLKIRLECAEKLLAVHEHYNNME